MDNSRADSHKFATNTHQWKIECAGDWTSCMHNIQPESVQSVQLVAGFTSVHRGIREISRNREPTVESARIRNAFQRVRTKYHNPTKREISRLRERKRRDVINKKKLADRTRNKRFVCIRPQRIGNFLFSCIMQIRNEAAISFDEKRMLRLGAKIRNSAFFVL